MLVSQGLTGDLFGLGSFRFFVGCAGAAGEARYGKLGSFCKSSFWLLAIGCWAGGNWVRFVFLGRRMVGVRQIGFVSHFWGGVGMKLGSFRAFWCEQGLFGIAFGDGDV